MPAIGMRFKHQKIREIVPRQVYQLLVRVHTPYIHESIGLWLVDRPRHASYLQMHLGSATDRPGRPCLLRIYT